MAATMAKFPLLGYFGGKKQLQKRRDFSIAAQQPEVQESQERAEEEERESVRTGKVLGTGGTPLRPVEKQVNVESKNMGREYGGDWLSSATRHVRIYAAYIDPETCAFDQTQMDKLTIILDPTNEFVWTSESCNKVYSYFQELVDHYEVREALILSAWTNHLVLLHGMCGYSFISVSCLC